MGLLTSFRCVHDEFRLPGFPVDLLVAAARFGVAEDFVLVSQVLMNQEAAAAAKTRKIKNGLMRYLAEKMMMRAPRRAAIAA